MSKYNPALHHRRSIRLKGYDYSQAGAYFVTMVTQDRECQFGEIAEDNFRPNSAGEMIARWWQELPNKFPSVELDECVIMPNHFHGIVVIVEDKGSKEGEHVGSPQPGAPQPGTPRSVGADPRVGPDLGAHIGAPQPGAPQPGTPRSVGADPRVGPDLGEHVGSPQPGAPQPGAPRSVGADLRVGPDQGAHIGAPQPGAPRSVGADLRVGPDQGAHIGAPQPGAPQPSMSQQRPHAPLSQIIQWFKTMTTNEYIRGVKQCGWPQFRGKLWQRNYYEHIIRGESELELIRKYIAENPVKWALDQENPFRQQASRANT